LNDLGIDTERPLEVVNWTNEEGGRFPPPMIGSAVFAGQMALEDAYDIKDLEGARFGDELARIGYKGDVPMGGREIGAYFECHIEQGPILESEEKSVGIVTGVQAMRWYEIRAQGRESRAGTTPPANRRDALTAAARIVIALDEIMQKRGAEGRCTVGVMEVNPGSPNVIPGDVFFIVDIRNPTVDELNQMDQELRLAIAALVADGTMQIEVKENWFSPPVMFDPGGGASWGSGCWPCSSGHHERRWA
jgi:N-carbamoyl-L-amino-acid hydrolase